MSALEQFEAATAVLQARVSYLIELTKLHDQLMLEIDAGNASIETAHDANQYAQRLSALDALCAQCESVEALAQDAIGQLTAWLIEAERHDADTAAFKRRPGAA